MITVTIPPSATWNTQDTLTLTAQSTLSPALSYTATVTNKVPAPILLVDDDRFFEQRDKYETALGAIGIPYDFWQTCPATGWCRENSPPLDVLRWYPIVVWWTGYDWYQPIQADQLATLQAYLDEGGRLYLSSQDFLYIHHTSPFSNEYLGVSRYTEETQPELARGIHQAPIDKGLGPWPLVYPFENLSDAIEPMPGTIVSLRDEWERGIELAHRGPRTPLPRHAVVFGAFPFEALPEDAHPVMLQQTVGWLSWLGDSTFAADRETASSGETITYTAVLYNDGLESITASFSNTIPSRLSLVPGSLTGPATYTPSTRLIAWEGTLGVGDNVSITYQTIVTNGLASLVPITNPATLGIDDQYIHFQRTSIVRVDAPDLSPSTLVCEPSPVEQDEVVTCTLTIENGGLGPAPAVVVTNLIPAATPVITSSVTYEGGGTIAVLSDTLRWNGTLNIGARVTVTYQLAIPTGPSTSPFYNVALLKDGTGGSWERPTWIWVDTRNVYLPLVHGHAP
jgi:uncharacterized repeat protein (TIGR01451 family)